MNRKKLLQQVEQVPEWDVAIIGGGATGLGVAVDAATRGFRTILLEASDFAKGTSSRSTKLVHGGVRYLEQGDIPLVLEALRERGLMHRNAPHLVHHLSFIVPRYQWWEGPFFGIGLKVYDALAGKLNLAPSHLLSREETMARIPNIEAEHLLGGVEYFDGQFDDARLAITLARTAVHHGACALNHARVTGLVKTDGLVSGVHFTDVETGRDYEVKARVVVNATGIFSDEIRLMDDAKAQRAVQPSQGVHLVLDRSFLQGDSAVMVPHTDDGRVLFVIPWHGKVLDTLDKAITLAGLEDRPCVTENLQLHGWRSPNAEPLQDWLAVYGSEAADVLALVQEDASLGELLHPRLPYQMASVVQAARQEQARTVEDVLSRRTRALLLDARAAIESAPKVADLLAKELGRDKAWVEAQVAEFTELAKGYSQPES